MGISAFDVLGKGNQNNTQVQAPAPSPNKGGGSAFDLIAPQTPQKELGFLDKIGNVIDNVGKLAGRTFAPGDVAIDPSSIINKIKAANDNGKLQQVASIAGNDIKNYAAKSFDLDNIQKEGNAFEDKGVNFVTKTIPDALNNPSKAISSLFDTSSGMVKSIPSSLLDMVNTPLKALSGIDVTSPNAPEENIQARAQDIKDTAGQIAAFIATEGASSVLAKTPLASKLLTLPIAKEATDAGLANVVSTSTNKIGNLTKQLVRGGLEAGTGGAAYGLVSGSGDPDQIDRVVGSAMQFAPLGAVISALSRTRPDLKVIKDNAELATNVQNFRKLQFDQDNTIKDLGNNTAAVVTSDDLANAVIKNKVLQAKTFPTVIEGVNPAKLGTLPPDLPYNVETHDDGSGGKTVSVLLVPKDVNVSTTPFKISGYMNGEVVSHEGGNYIIDSTTPDEATLIGSGGVKKTVPLEEIRRTDNGILMDPMKIMDQQYQSLKQELFTKTDIDDPAEAADQVSNLNDKLSKLPYPKQLYFANRLASDLIESGPRNQPSLRYLYESLQRPSVGTVEDFVNQASTNGYKVEIGDAGQVVLKDMSDGQGRVVAQGKNINEATDFLNKSGQAKGDNLLAGLQDPIGSGTGFKFTGEPPNPNRPEPIPPLQAPAEWDGKNTNQVSNAWQAMSNLASFTAHWFTQAPDRFKAMDGTYGTRLYSQVYDALKVARQASITAADPYVKKLISINKMAKGVTLSQLQTIMSYMETMSPKSIIDKGYSRPLTPIEQDFASKLTDNATIQKAFDYNRFKSNNADSPENIAGYEKNMGVDQDTKDYASMMDNINQYAKGNADLGKIVRLARAINDGGVDRSAFAKANNMTPQHIAIANALEALSKELAVKFGVDPKDIINNWMTHARLYSAGDLTGAMNLFNRPNEAEASEPYFKQARTGEIDAYERNPINALYRYIYSGFDAMHYSGPEANAKNYLKKVLSVPQEAGGLIPDAEKGKVQTLTEGFLNDIRGRTPMMSAATESAVKQFLNTHVPGLSISARNFIVGLNKMVQVGTQGFKIGAGVRDLIGGSGTILMNFGPERLLSILEKGVTETANGNQLIKNGHISGLTLDRLANPTEDESSNLSQLATGAKGAFNSVANLSLKASGQEGVFNVLRQGAYMDTFTRVAEAARDLRSGKIDQAGFLDKIQANRDFDPSIVAEIKNQLNQSPSRLDELAKYLARESTRQVTPSYTPGDNPTGWGRNIGKVIGQYGSYSSWLLGNLKSAVTRGSIGDILGRVGRFSAYTGTIAALNASTGLNFSPWYIHRVGFSGGPLGQLGLNLYNAIGSTGYEQKTNADQLQRLEPYSNGSFHKQFYIPASFAFSDLTDAVSGNPLSAIGIREQKTP